MDLTKVNLILCGVLLGMLFAWVVFSFYKPSVVEVDLNQIISSYAKQASKEDVTKNYKQSFKQLFDDVIRQGRSNLVIVKKGGVLTKQKLTDYTATFIQQMGLEDHENKQC